MNVSYISIICACFFTGFLGTFPLEPMANSATQAYEFLILALS